MRNIVEYMLEQEIDKIFNDILESNDEVSEIITESYNSKAIATLTKGNKVMWLVDPSRFSGNGGSVDSTAIVCTKDGKTVPGIDELEDKDIIAYYTKDKPEGETQYKDRLKTFKHYFKVEDLSFDRLKKACTAGWLEDPKEIKYFAHNIFPQSILFTMDQSVHTNTYNGKEFGEAINGIILIMGDGTKKVWKKYFKVAGKDKANKDSDEALSKEKRQKLWENDGKLLDAKLGKFEQWLKQNKEKIMANCKGLADLLNSKEYNQVIFKLFNVILKLYKGAHNNRHCNEEGCKYIAQAFYNYLSQYALNVINEKPEIPGLKHNMHSVYHEAIIIAKNATEGKSWEEKIAKAKKLWDAKVAKNKDLEKIDDVIKQAA